MTLDSSSGVPKIPKQSRNDKASGQTLGSRLALWAVTVGVFALASQAAALPVRIAWQVPLNRSEAYTLEVASDPGFSTIVHASEVRGSEAYGWEAPGEGIYHWRLARPSQQGQGGDVITFVSGSFAAIDPKASRERQARLSWQPEEGADRYKLYVVDASGAARTMLSTAASFVVPKADQALMIEVVPYSGEQRLFRHYHFNPTLVLDSGFPASPSPVAVGAPAEVSPAPAVAAAPASASEGAPSVVDAAEGSEPVPPLEPVPAATASRPRLHLVHVFGLAGEETLRLQKLDVDLKSRKAVYGGGAGVWSQPLGGLAVGAFATYHEHQGEARQEEALPGVQVPLASSRYTAEVTIGWDVLSALASRWHRLVVSFAAAGAQMPFLPLQFSSSSASAPKLEKKAISLLGGTVSYGYFGAHVAAIVDAGQLADATDDATMGFQRLVLEVYLSERLALHVGGLNRLTVAALCHEQRAICLAEGKARTTAREQAAFVGLGVVFR